MQLNRETAKENGLHDQRFIFILMEKWLQNHLVFAG